MYAKLAKELGDALAHEVASDDSERTNSKVS